MAVSWTREQQQVIELRNRSLLVSAAAGSGKTAVLVQRIIELVCDRVKPVDIDRLLIVTFTKAAAGEMRERVLKAIEKRLEAEPDNVHLRRQELLAGHAYITTIDSFCLSVIREHYQEIQLDPSFRIADEGELTLLQDDVLKSLLEDEYSAGSESFLNFMEAYAPGRDDERAAKLIIQLYGFCMANPRPLDWLDDCLKAYNVTDTEGALENQSWMQWVISYAKQELRQQEEIYDRLIEECEDDDGPLAYAVPLKQEREAIREALEAQGYAELRKAVHAISFAAKPRKKKTDTFSDELAASIWGVRETVKKTVRAQQSEFFCDDEKRVREKHRMAGSHAAELVRLTREFIERFSVQKRRKNLVDFSDLEHMALDILSRQTPEGERPTETAMQYRDSFAEIMIDEYQDSNYVQELILTSIAKPDQSNLFMVGDVKQSIYRFRLARPELFMGKYESYDAEESLHQKIELHANFRSRCCVLDTVNYFFYQLMQKSVGNVQYDDNAALNAGRVFENSGEHRISDRAELLLLDLEDVVVADESDEAEQSAESFYEETQVRQEDRQTASYNSREWEAFMVAKRIRELTDPESGIHVWDGELGEYRRAQYGDIAILLRTAKDWTDEFTAVLKSCGIPAAAETGSGYFSALEVQTVLSLLEIIDNPLQDIPLAAVMHSPIGGFSDEELARLRVQGEAGAESPRLYEAVTAYIASHEQDRLAARLSGFVHVLEDYRRRSMYLSLHELITYVLDDSGYYDYVSAMPGAKVRCANIDMLIERAKTFEKTSYHGVFSFVRYINRLKKYSVDYGLAQGDKAADCVRIMTIHKSKGLEFPICFVSGLGKCFNERDIKASMLFSEKYGIGTDAIDVANRTKESTLMKTAVKLETRLEDLGEELRVLYVAMTRAKEKLIMTGAMSGLNEYLKAHMHAEDKGSRVLSWQSITGARRMLDWIVSAAVKHKSFSNVYEMLEIPIPLGGVCFNERLPMSVELFTRAELDFKDKIEAVKNVIKKSELEFWKKTAVDERTEAFIRERLAADYEYDCLSKLNAAFSVSELKKAESEAESEAQPLPGFDYEKDIETVLPNFIAEGKKINAASRGTIYHRVFEELELGNKDLKGQIDRLVRSGVLTAEESSMIREADFEIFTASKLGQRAASADAVGHYHREMPFILGIPAQEMSAQLSGAQALAKPMRRSDDREEYISIQGVIDAWFEEPDGIVLIDFKTDRVYGENAQQELKRRYEKQLYYYRRALEQMTGTAVKEMYIYSTTLGRAICL